MTSVVFPAFAKSIPYFIILSDFQVGKATPGSPLVGWTVDRRGTFVPLLIAIGFVPLTGSLIGLLWPEQPKLDETVTQV